MTDTMLDRWGPFLYQYSVGGLLFFATLGLALRWRALDTARRADRRLLAALLGGYCGFLALHGAWIYCVR